MGIKEHGEANRWSRVSQRRQITLNVWGNILYSWLGMDLGFDSLTLQAFPNALSYLGAPSFGFPANRQERQMGIDLFNSHPGSVSPSTIWDVIVREDGKITGSCAMMAFPEPFGHIDERFCLNHPYSQYW